MRNRKMAMFVLAGLSLWVIGAVLDSLVFSTGVFLDWLIFRVPSNELYFRSAVVLVFTLVGIAASRTSLMQKLTLEQLRESKEKYSSLMDHLPVGVYRMTPDGRILEANRRFAELLAYQNVDDLRKVNLNDIYVKKSDRIGQLEKLRDSTVFAEFELRLKNGRTVWVRDYPKAILNSDGKIEYIDGVFVETHGIDAIMRDIAEHRRLEAMKDQFISAVTHELRTPLISIKGYVDYIIAKETRSIPDSVKSNIEVVSRNTDRLLELTDDLLNIQRMETGMFEFRLQSVSIREILMHCVEELQPLLKQKNQDIELDLPSGTLSVKGDRLRLTQVVLNLLDNATKFTPNGGKITVRVEEDNSALSVHICDTGIGLDKKDLERVFEPFAVIEKPTYFKGTGLGLSLAKRLVEAHGGKIWVSSPGKGQGATFGFTLPKLKLVSPCLN